jgi:hypothetical protein
MTTVIRSVEGLECVYCGDVAKDRDHVVPQSLVAEESKTWHSDRVVPACHDCNGALHNKVLLTIAERASWLAKRLKRKYDKLSIKAWTEDELQELGPTLRAFVKSQESRRYILAQRLHRCEAVAKLTHLTPQAYWDNLS